MSAAMTVGSAPREEAATHPMRALAAILIVGALLRLGLWAWYAPLPLGPDDERDYNALAIQLVEQGTFGYHPDRPSSLRPPLYPALVAGVYSLCGLENYQAVRLVQVLLSLLNVVILFRLGTEAISRRVGLWLAGLFCFYPTLVGMNFLLLTETLFTLLLSTACWMVVRYYRQGAVWYAAAAGVFLGLAALTRSVVWLAPPFLAVYLLLTGRAGPFGGAVPEGFALIGLGKRPLAALALLLGFALTLAPWAIRNTRLQGTFVAVDAMSGRNLMMGNYQHTPLYRAWDAISLQGDKAWIHEVRETFPEVKEEGMTQGQLDKLAMQLGVKFIRDNPGLTLRRDVVKFLDFWGLERELIARARDGWLGPLPRGGTLLVAAVTVLPYVALLFAGALGAFLAGPEDRRIHWFLLAVIVFVTGAHTVVFGHSRYHLPLMPLVLLYAASAIVKAREVWASRRSAAFVAAIGTCVILMVGWGWLALVRDLRPSEPRTALTTTHPN